MRAVLDSFVLVSAFLRPQGAIDALLDAAIARRFELWLSEPILAETSCALSRPKLAKTYRYVAADVDRFLALLASIAQVASVLAPIPPTCRDPDDDHVSPPRWHPRSRPSSPAIGTCSPLPASGTSRS